MSAFVPIIEAPDENRGLFGIIGSNTSLTAVFGSDTPETYTHYYAESGGARSGSNFGFLVGVSNELFTIRPRPEGPEGLEGSNGAAASAAMASNGFFGLGTDEPKERLHVAGNMVLDGKIFDSFGTELVFGGGSWRKLADDSDYHPTISAPATGVFEMTCNVILQRYIGNDMTLNLNIDGTVITRPSAPGGDYTMNLPVQMDMASYPIETTVGELWLSASSNIGSGSTRTIFKALAKSIPGSNESIALRYLTGTTEVSLGNINSGVDISLQGIVRYQTVLYNTLGPDDSITIPGDQMKWMPVREPHPMFEAPLGASSTTLLHQGLMRYLGDELIYRVLVEVTLDSQPSSGEAGALDYTISLEYPIAPDAYINSNAIIGDLWLTVINGTTATNFKAYARTVDGDTSKVAIRFLNGTFDQSLAEIDAGSTIRIQGNVVYKAEQVASLAIPRAYLPNNLYQDDDGNVALNNYGRPMRARFEIIETSNLPALIVDQHSDADIAQFRSNVDDIKLIIDSRGHIGVGTNVAPYPFTVKGGMLFDGTMYDATGNAIWIPGSSVNWKATATAPVITVPTGGVWTQLPGAAKGIWRYMGNEINYNVTISGVLSVAATDTEEDFRLSVPYPVNQAAYLPESIIGDLWADVIYGANSNTFKAYARPDPSDSNQVRLRVLSGTKDDSLATLLAGSALTIKGEVKYSTTDQVQTINPYGTYDPLDLQQDVTGQVILNGYGNLPRARLDIVSGPDASNSNALVLDQRGTGKSLIVMNQGIPTTIIDSAGHLGIGTLAPVAELHVEGDVYTSGSIEAIGDVRAQNITAAGLLTASNIRVLGDYVILDTITSNTEQMVITNDGTGPALKVTQTGANSIAEFFDDGNALAFKVANDGLIGIGTADPLAKLHVVGSAMISSNLDVIGNVYPGAINLVGTGDTAIAATHYFVETGSDGFIRPKTLANARTEIVTTATVNAAAATTVGTITSGIWNAGALTSSSTVSAGTQILAPSGDLVTAPGFSWTGNTGTGIYRPAADTVAIVTNSNERMRVLANGYVGIGTTIPLAELDVRGQMTMNFVIGNYIGLNAYYDNNWRNHIASASTGAYAFRQESDRLQILTSAGNATAGSVLGINERMCIQASSGNLGIGTTIPKSPLHCHGQLILSQTSGTTPWAILSTNSGNTGGDGCLQISSYTDTAYTSSAVRVLINNSGNVGIGTHFPQAKLHVQGNIQTTEQILNNSGRPMCSSTGGILQVLNFSNNSDSITKSSSGQVFQLSITPSTSSSKILIIVTTQVERLGTGYIQIHLRRNTTNLLLNFGYDIGYNVTSGSKQSSSATYVDAPQSTAAVSYNVYSEHANASGNFIYRAGGNSITLMEIAF